MGTVGQVVDQALGLIGRQVERLGELVVADGFVVDLDAVVLAGQVDEESEGVGDHAVKVEGDQAGVDAWRGLHAACIARGTRPVKPAA